MVQLKGEPIKSSECYEDDYEAKARYYGEIIGQLHLILQSCEKDIVCNEPNMYQDIKNWAIPEVKKIMQLPDSFYKEYLDNFAALYPKLIKHVIHRDPNPSNIIMLNGNINGFIDFELSERNVRLFDPCYAATAILSESFAECDQVKMKKWFSIYQNILLGYDSVCQLSDAEKKSIPYVIYSIQMICVAYFSSMVKYEELAKTNRKMLAWLYENRELLTID
jgi:Ser/Thr protein kinase RdoA (MazF antagonist)